MENEEQETQFKKSKDGPFKNGPKKPYFIKIIRNGTNNLKPAKGSFQ